MAFNQDNFAPVHSRTSNVPGHWSYKSDVDDAAIIILPDYFAAKSFQLEIDDQIYVAAADFPLLIAYKGIGQASIILAPDGTPGGPIPATNVSYDPSGSPLTSTNVQAALDEVAAAAFDNPNEVLAAESLVDQNPVAVDTPIQLSFGPAVGTIADPVMVDAAGTITINESDYYRFIATFQFGRAGAAMVSTIHARGLINGIQSGPTYTVLLDNANIIVPLQFEIAGFTPTNTLITVQIVRDSSGNNSGGVLSEPVTIGWKNSASASLTVIKESV